ncbi:hypothetical protein GIB67_004766, partial [Kingdonia uniflora]
MFEVFELTGLISKKGQMGLEFLLLRTLNRFDEPRMTLLLGPPGSGKTTLLKGLAGKLDSNIKVSKKITYCGHELNEFVPLRTCAYISQHDLHYGKMTVRENLDFFGYFLGVRTKYEMLAELSRCEKGAEIKPDPEIDAFMKATALAGQETSFVTDYIFKVCFLISKEMLIGPAKVPFMDEISIGLDSSTTFHIVKFMKQMAHIMDVTMIISLLQPPSETFDLFDDVIVLSEELAMTISKLPRVYIDAALVPIVHEE